MAEELGAFPLIRTEDSHAVDHESIPKEQQHPRTDPPSSAGCPHQMALLAASAPLLARAKSARSAICSAAGAQGIAHRTGCVQDSQSFEDWLS